MYLIRHKKTKKERLVTSKEWETIEGNELTKGTYKLINKDAGDGKAEMPTELIPEQYKSKTDDELKELLTGKGVEFSPKAKTSKLISLLMEADKNNN